MAAPDLFGFETFESGSTPWSFDSVGTVFGAATAALDTTSKVVGANSIAYGATGEGAALARYLLGATRTSIFIQMRMFLPTGFSVGAAGYMGLFALRTSGDVDRIYFNMEDYGTIRLTAGGEVAYTDTAVDLPVNSVFKLEIQVIKSATVGRIRVWLNNDVEGSPDFDSGNVNTGANNFQKLDYGITYTEVAGSTYYMDNMAASTAFIGAGASLAASPKRMLMGMGT